MYWCWRLVTAAEGGKSGWFGSGMRWGRVWVVDDSGRVWLMAQCPEQRGIRIVGPMENRQNSVGSFSGVNGAEVTVAGWVWGAAGWAYPAC
jgi:hypothetical protein